jgi:hypothetical protein
LEPVPPTVVQPEASHVVLIFANAGVAALILIVVTAVMIAGSSYCYYQKFGFYCLFGFLHYALVFNRSIYRYLS